MRTTVILKKLLLPVLLVFLACGAADSIENHGLLSIDDYFSNDSAQSYSTHYLTSRFRLDSTKLNQSGTLAFHFDGSKRVNLGSKNSNTSAKNERINTLFMDYTGKKFYMAGGRFWPKELPVELVDGLNFVYQSERFGAGVFGGFRPDPYKEVFSTDSTTAGAYAFYRKESSSAALAYVNNGFKGGVDRQYVYGQVSYFPVSELMLFTTASLDISPLSKKVKLTNGIVELTYRPDYRKSISIGYNQFRAIRLYRSSTATMDDSRQQAYYVSGNYRLKDKYTLYGRAERQSRFFPTIEARFRDLYILRAGVNTENVLKTGFNMDLSTSYSFGDGSRHSSYNVEMNRLISEVFHFSLNAAYMQNYYSTTNRDNIWTYGVSGYLYLKKSWTLSLTFDREDGRSYKANHLLTRIAFKF